MLEDPDKVRAESAPQHVDSAALVVPQLAALAGQGRLWLRAGAWGGSRGVLGLLAPECVGRGFKLPAERAHALRPQVWDETVLEVLKTLAV